MCGIWFSVGWGNLPSSVIDVVKHRGPDGRGWQEFSSDQGPVILAHRRLAIIDLSSSGYQPMSSCDKRLWITFNGEVYNYIEIRKELENLGCSFISQTDTEVVLQAYEVWGPACLHRFNGMFAFVIWNDQEKTAFVARDRFGVKPLYVHQDGQKIAFASEIKQFYEIPGFHAHIHAGNAHDFLAHGMTDHNEGTFIEEVFRVPFGGAGVVASGTFEPYIWYTLPTQEISRPLEEAAALFREIFLDAVRLRFRSDVRVGALLSGGLDSSAIVCAAREFFPPFDTFSVCYPGESVDESVYIDAVIQEKNTIAHKISPGTNTLRDEIDKLLYHQEEPFGGTSLLAEWSVFKLAHEQGVSVTLGGQGPDEQLAGYHPMFGGFYGELIRTGRFIRLIKEGCARVQKHRVPLRRLLADTLSMSFPEIHSRVLSLLHPRGPCSWLKLDPQQKTRWFTDFIAVDSHKTLSDTCRWYMKTNLQALVKHEDRDSMAFGIESRLPFLDYRLVELIASLPAHYRIRNGQTKYILRDALRGILIESVRTRQSKIGFATPEDKWFTRDFRSDLDKGVASFAVNNRRIIDEKELKSASSGDTHLAWRVYIFDKWMRQWKVKWAQ
ncbi:MAG: asparagine synthase (glutamine-hydrolyzing) [Holosporales bacterium]|jgi:asparagine synthase (glutamine-hydrolysing)|nr:asparagine synthase (glutamine-hydrolyzing) [Holosporales bacterium]